MATEIDLHLECTLVAPEGIAKKRCSDSIGRSGLGKFVLVSSPCLGGVVSSPTIVSPSNIDIVERRSSILRLRILCSGVPGKSASTVFHLGHNEVPSLVKRSVDSALLMIYGSRGADRCWRLRVVT
jgi:hypothetical protein